MSPLQILITNAYSAKNKGDAGIIQGMILDLHSNSLFKGAEITISSADFEDDRNSYGVPVVPSFQSLALVPFRNQHLRQVFFLLFLLPLTTIWAVVFRAFKIRIPLPNKISQLIGAYENADLIIAAGGGYLYTRSVIRGYVVLLMSVYCFLFGRLLAKPVYIYSQSIGPFKSRFQECLVKQALKHARLIETREDFSHRLVDSWGIQTPIHRSIDSAFLVPSVAYDQLTIDCNRTKVGVTARKWFRDPTSHLKYVSTFAEFLDWLVEEKNCQIIFIPQVTFSEFHDDDRKVAREILKECRYPDSIILIENELEPAQIKGLCSRMDYFIGTRLHSCIYSISTGVPTIAIAYQPKTTGIMETMGLDHFVVSIEEISTGSLFSVFTNLVEERYTLRNLLSVTSANLREGVYQNSKWIAVDFLNFKK